MEMIRVTAQRVGDNHHPARQRSHGEVPRLLVRAAQVFERQCAAGKNERGVSKGQAVFSLVRLILRFIPLELHRLYRLSIRDAHWSSGASDRPHGSSSPVTDK